MMVSSKIDEEGEKAVDKGKSEKVGEGIEGMIGKGIKSADSKVVPFEKGKKISWNTTSLQIKTERDSRSKSLYPLTLRVSLERQIS